MPPVRRLAATQAQSHRRDPHGAAMLARASDPLACDFATATAAYGFLAYSCARLEDGKIIVPLAPAALT